MAATNHKRPNRLRQAPPAKGQAKRKRPTHAQIRFFDEPQFYCGFCRAAYVSYDYPSERVCPYCGHSEV